MHSRKYVFDPKFTIKDDVIMKWGHGCKIWDWSIILHYFAEYLTCMLTLGLRSYRSSTLVLDLKMWENFEPNLPVWCVYRQKSNNLVLKFFFRAEASICPGSQSCSKCSDFGSDEDIQCEQKCKLCPLCKIFYVKPGCDYCGEGVEGCTRDCNKGKIICNQCKQNC